MSQRAVKQNYYEILEVDIDAPHHTIQEAYQRAKETYSPGSPALYTMFTPEEARELTLMIEEAYSVLGNHGKRQVYDQKLRQQLDLALPDIEPATEQPKKQKEKKASPPPKAKEEVIKTEVPKGFSKTRFGVFEVNEAIEEEIKNQTVFDGPFLQMVRNYKKINLEQLAAETRIGKSYIVAVENNDYEGLPAPVFVRGFVVQFARALGLKEQEVAKSYMERYKKVRAE